MKVILTVASLSLEFGGPSRSVPALAHALAQHGVAVELIACESEPGYSPPTLSAGKFAPTRLMPVRSRRGRWFAARNDFYRTLCQTAPSNDTVIHDNGLWLPTNHAVASAARSLAQPFMISPRGMLSDWSIQHHRWRKRVAWSLYQRRDLFCATALHGTSHQEAAEFRRAGFRQAIAVVPNGVAIPESVKCTRNGTTRTALFLSRLHPIKGLLDLVEAWAKVRPNGWRMLVAGNDEDAHRREVELAVQHHQLSRVFSFTGVVSDEAKWALYRSADLVLLPSHSENFGIVVAEALASGVPVITTRGTPWRDLIEHRCGWWEEIGAAPLAAALEAATALSDDERRAMGQRGRELVERKYSWQRVAADMKAVYAWLLGQGERPDCVLLN
jgi:glycosyltransferase involved in cell wall biosynthesis